MLRTRVGQVIPTTPSPTVGERILSNWSRSQRDEFELAMKQAMMEYQEGKLSQSQMIAERQRAMQLLQRDLQSIRTTREKLLSGELDRSAAIQRFNAGQENAARRTYSSQAFAAQRDAAREAGKTKTEKEKAEAGIDLTKEQKALINQVTADSISTYSELSQDEQDQISLGEYVFRGLNQRMSEANVDDPKSAPLVGLDPREVMKQADQVVRNIGAVGQIEMEAGLERIQSKEPGIMMPGPTTLPAIPGPGSIYGEMDVDSEIEDEETVPGVRRPTARPVGYRPTLAGETQLSEDIRGELDRLGAAEADVIRRLQSLYDTPLPKVDEFDLIDQTRRIWREKFGRNPSAEETRSIFRKAKSPETPVEPVEDVMGVAGSREELKERVEQLQRPPIRRLGFEEEEEDIRAKLRFKFYDPGLQRKVIRDGYGNIVEDETPQAQASDLSVQEASDILRQSARDPSVFAPEQRESLPKLARERMMNLTPEEQEEFDQTFWRQQEDTERFRKIPQLRKEVIQPPVDSTLQRQQEDIEQSGYFQPIQRERIPPAFRDETRSVVGDLYGRFFEEPASPVQTGIRTIGQLAQGAKDLIVPPIPKAIAKSETFEDIDDIYGRAVKRAKSGSISIGPKDRETVDRTIRLWKNGGKKLSPEQLIETIEKGFEDMPEDRVEQILAYMVRKMNAEMTK